MAEGFDRAAYLARLGLDRAPPVSLEGLERLHWAQVKALAFENLDIALGRGIDASPGAVFAKLVTGRRGGYCHELNGLLLQALQAFGFTARPLAARVMQGPDSPVNGFTHTAALVDLPEGAFLADAGFGAQTPRRPLRLEAGCEVARGPMTWRLDTDSEFGWRLSLAEADGWKRLYCFDLRRIYPADIALSNHWTATHPESRFTQGPLAVRHLEEGRLVLVGGRITRHLGSDSETSYLPDAASLIDGLQQAFGLSLDASPEELAALERALAHSRRMAA